MPACLNAEGLEWIGGGDGGDGGIRGDGRMAWEEIQPAGSTGYERFPAFQLPISGRR